MIIFLGMLMLYPGTTAPSGWALCNGARMSVSQNTALYAATTSALTSNGTYFWLPNLTSPAGTVWIIATEGLFPAYSD